MAEIHLVGKSALSFGSDLWILAPRSASQWTRRIDWLSGLQILKFEKRVVSDASKEISAILQEEELEPMIFSRDENAPLIVSCAEYLPNRFCVVLPIHLACEQWLGDLLQVWNNLNSPSTRIFFVEQKHQELFARALSKRSDREKLAPSLTWTSEQDIFERSVQGSTTALDS